MHYPVEFKGELVFFSTTDRIKTYGFLMESGEDVLIFVHGMGGNFAKAGFLQGASQLLNRGISFFSFNNRGADIVKSFKNLRGDKYYTLGTAFEKFEDSARDIKGAINYLETRGFRNFHLIGHSTGCQKILYYTWKRKDKRVKSLSFLSPSDDYPIWKDYLGADMDKSVNIAQNMEDLGRGKQIHYFVYRRTNSIWTASRFLSFADRERVEASLFNYDSPLATLSKVKIPMLFIFGSSDETLYRNAQFYEEKIKKARFGLRTEIVKILHGDHSFHGKEKEVFEKIAEFVSDIK